jgi:hypothetical protein
LPCRILRNFPFQTRHFEITLTVIARLRSLLIRIARVGSFPGYRRKERGANLGHPAYLDEMTFRFDRRKRSDLFIDTLRHMVTADPLTFEELTA